MINQGNSYSPNGEESQETIGGAHYLQQYFNANANNYPFYQGNPLLSYIAQQNPHQNTNVPANSNFNNSWYLQLAQYMSLVQRHTFGQINKEQGPITTPDQFLSTTTSQALSYVHNNETQNFVVAPMNGVGNRTNMVSSQNEMIQQRANGVVRFQTQPLTQPLNLNQARIKIEEKRIAGAANIQSNPSLGGQHVIHAKLPLQHTTYRKQVSYSAADSSKIPRKATVPVKQKLEQDSVTQQSVANPRLVQKYVRMSVKNPASQRSTNGKQVQHSNLPIQQHVISSNDDQRVPIHMHNAESSQQARHQVMAKTIGKSPEIETPSNTSEESDKDSDRQQKKIVHDPKYTFPSMKINLDEPLMVTPWLGGAEYEGLPNHAAFEYRRITAQANIHKTFFIKKNLHAVGQEFQFNINKSRVGIRRECASAAEAEERAKNNMSSRRSRTKKKIEARLCQFEIRYDRKIAQKYMQMEAYMQQQCKDLERICLSAGVPAEKLLQLRKKAGFC